jgi:hypothetical protein
MFIIKWIAALLMEVIILVVLSFVASVSIFTAMQVGKDWGDCLIRLGKLLMLTPVDEVYAA